MNRAPRLPLPPVLRSDVVGTWAHDTMSRRVRSDILARVFRENEFTAPNILAALRKLDLELANAESTPLTPIENDGGPDVKEWNEVILKEILEKGETWLSAPWCDAEFYLYRRIMGAIDWFKEGVDPFLQQKQLGLSSAAGSIDALSMRLEAVAKSRPHLRSDSLVADFKAFVLASLWGNRMDLSLWPVGSGRTADAITSVIAAGSEKILANDIDSLCEYVLSAMPLARVDIIVDNAGFELFTDLCLADIFIMYGIAKRVHIQLKAHPTFVSDAMGVDVMHTVERTGNTRWDRHIKYGHWVLEENFFWVQPTPFWNMPQDIYNELATSSRLVFIKGDANYRRLLGDRAWEFDTPFPDVAGYFPAPVVALRTLKAELGCGMPKETTERAAKEDSKWLVAGKYGVVQFLNTIQYR